MALLLKLRVKIKIAVGDAEAVLIVSDIVLSALCILIFFQTHNRLIKKE